MPLVLEKRCFVAPKLMFVSKAVLPESLSFFLEDVFCAIGIAEYRISYACFFWITHCLFASFSLLALRLVSAADSFFLTPKSFAGTSSGLLFFVHGLLSRKHVGILAKT